MFDGATCAPPRVTDKHTTRGFTALLVSWHVTGLVYDLRFNVFKVFRFARLSCRLLLSKTDALMNAV